MMPSKTTDTTNTKRRQPGRGAMSLFGIFCLAISVGFFNEDFCGVSLCQYVYEPTGRDLAVNSAKVNNIPPPPLALPSLHSETNMNPLPSESEAKESAASSSKTKNSTKEVKIAFFMTTHLSKQHLEFLTKCWPAAVQHLRLLRQSDLIVYTSDKTHDDLFLSLGFYSVTFRRYVNELPKQGSVVVVNTSTPVNSTTTTDVTTDVTQYGASVKQYGAIRGMVEPFQEENSDWFEGYDWIVRLNPDVLIRRDDWLLETMHNEAVDGIFFPFRPKLSLHSDFYAFRPETANKQVLLRGGTNAEEHLYLGFQHLLESGRVSYIPNAMRIPNKWARIVGPKCDIIHWHPYVNECPTYWNATDNEYF